MNFCRQLALPAIFLLTASCAASAENNAQPSSRSLRDLNDVPAERQADKDDDEVRVDRTQRTDPRPSQRAVEWDDDSRYRTDQGWSRDKSSWWGRRNSDLPNTGYTDPVRKKDR